MRAWEGRPGLGTEAPHDNNAAGGLSGSIISPRDTRGLMSAADEPWFWNAVVALRDLVEDGGCFTVDAIREAVEPPTGSGAFGALMTAAARAGWIRPVGQVASAWPSRHGGAVTLWRAAHHVGGGAA